jgi:hypothetical protein
MPEGFTVTVKGGRTLWCDDYQCKSCGRVVEITLAQGEELESCECGGELEVVIDKPKAWEFGRPKGDDRIIWSDRQIESSHGKDWRETNKRRTEGGCGARQHYDRGSHGAYKPVG